MFTSRPLRACARLVTHDEAQLLRGRSSAARFCVSVLSPAFDLHDFDHDHAIRQRGSSQRSQERGFLGRAQLCARRRRVPVGEADRGRRPRGSCARHPARSSRRVAVPRERRARAGFEAGDHAGLDEERCRNRRRRAYSLEYDVSTPDRERSQRPACAQCQVGRSASTGTEHTLIDK